MEPCTFFLEVITGEKKNLGLDHIVEVGSFPIPPMSDLKQWLYYSVRSETSPSQTLIAPRGPKNVTITDCDQFTSHHSVCSSFL